ncbi:MAG: hypothetical protein U5L96_17005, partial [Owenweeksia sp.]|nr:hypothetical protein [Owenweeksia sp.]
HYKMSASMHYNNGGGIIGQPGTDPQNGQDFYNYLRSLWLNGNNLIIENPTGFLQASNSNGYVANNMGTKTTFVYPGHRC